MTRIEAALCGLVCVPVRDFRGAGAGRLVEDRERHPWGGYTFFGGDLEAVASLISRLRATSETPLLFASDLERGLGQQLTGGTSFPPPMTLGAAADPELAREVARATGREAAAVGLNCVFAPVLDLVNERENPIVCTRAFGDDPEAVGELGAAFVVGLQEGGVLATAKHFPGHGRTRADSHSVLPVVRAGAGELRAADLAPFRRAVGAGVGLVMSAHVAYPALEGREGVPATLSRRILNDLLRGEMGFSGAVVSDALMMGALEGVDPGELAVRALHAGVDCLLYPPDPAALVAALAKRIDAGDLPWKAVDVAAGRIRSVLSRVDAGGTPSLRDVGSTEARALAVRAAAAGLVRVGELPSPGGSPSLVLLLLDGGVAREDVVLPEVAAAPGREFRWVVPAEASPALAPDLGRFEQVWLAWLSPIRAWKGRAGFSPEAAAFAADLLRACPAARLISFSSPFILGSLPALRGAILAFGEVAACQVAVGEALAGRVTPSGRLPVVIPGQSPTAARVSSGS